AALAGVTLLHDLGYVASGTASSYESVVVMDELVRWVKAYLRGVTIDEESLAVEEIAAVGPGGTHLSRKYSRRHYRDWFLADLIGQESHDAWVSGGASSLLERAAARTRELREGERDYRLSPEASQELERLVEKGRERALRMP
ncbi:MAG TPA: trimethylamine methyltransferase family protein, partial [Thermoleophilia bacterium]|nr:trimethylamine methyltransferase family protein [Thermoleophilia bacterium]